ncbi:MAG: hypothetical protein GY765_03830, partial [bacterium]|nr:hypothetical protein [bacterium]
MAKAGGLFENSLNDSELQEFALKVGYTVERIQEGKTLFDNVDTLYELQKIAQGEQYTATRFFNGKQVDGFKIYMYY